MTSPDDYSYGINTAYYRVLPRKKPLSGAIFVSAVYVCVLGGGAGFDESYDKVIPSKIVHAGGLGATESPKSSWVLCALLCFLLPFLTLK